MARSLCDATGNSHSDLRAEKFFPLCSMFGTCTLLCRARAFNTGGSSFAQLAADVSEVWVNVNTKRTVRNMHPVVGIWELGQ